MKYKLARKRTLGGNSVFNIEMVQLKERSLKEEETVCVKPF